ncbi:LacI family transcriptional regulator [Arenivirga flava]|uniref:LacI family transcriptional regulator n=2 Tax=Arenivirga flava TaxID=1930060 RepID=A0AA37UUZ7_9MICO|nr:LacI family transcriptional regulator [Arenivirga flava]
MADVALHAGVSLGTVSNVLNNPSAVKPAKRERVLASIRELGFVRNQQARSLASGRADTIGFVVVDLANSFFVDIARGAEEYTAQHGYKILLANSDVDSARQSTYLELFEEFRVAGMMLAPLDGPLESVEVVRGRGTPVVQVNWPGSDGETCGVEVDEVHGGRLAAEHLIARGARRLLFAGGPFDLHAVAQRLEGARAAVRAHAGVELEVVETTRITVAAGDQLGEQLGGRAATQRPDGLIAASDALATGAIQRLRSHGVRVPEDMLVIGYDNNHLTADSIVPISTISQPGREMGQRAAALLLEEIAGDPEHVHRSVLLRPALIQRQSTAVPEP